MGKIRNKNSETEICHEEINKSLNARDKKHKSKKIKKHKKSKKKKSKHNKYSSSSSSSDEQLTKKGENSTYNENLEFTKEICKNSNRDEWMSLQGSFATFSKSDLNKEKEKEKSDLKIAETYVPGQSSRELNPYWKSGGDGLPSENKKLNFMKPHFEYDSISKKNDSIRKDNWKKKPETSLKHQTIVEANENLLKQENLSSSQGKEENVVNQQTLLTDQQMNELAAKLVKAEILGNQSAIDELKQKLDAAREARKHQPIPSITSKINEQSVILTTTDSRGLSRPLPKPSAQNDPYYGRKLKNKKSIVETHVSGKRAKYYADDDKHTLRDMFENERFNTTNDQNKEFADIVSKHRNPNDDLEDIFAEKIRSCKDVSKSDDKAKMRAIREHERLSQTLDNCDKCLDSNKMEKHLIIAMGENVYLSLLPSEGLHEAHCCIVPMRHVGCSVMLDEEVWREICDFRKALTRMFHAHSMDVVFFENAIYLNRRPHMVIQCVPGPSKDMELLPFYFKKAIQECEGEWSHNKKLIDLTGKEITKAIPKGLPYFWVDFGECTGFAHVIEEQDRFPRFFAQEIIGGMLELEPRMWRHPKKKNFPTKKVNELIEWWKPFDITEK